jgi:hypothetical protein
MPLEYNDAATETGVADDGSEDTVQRPPNPRDEVLAQLAAQHQKVLDEEAGVKPEPEEKQEESEENEALDKVGSESNNGTEAEKAEEVKTAPKKEPEVELVTIRVDGVPMQVPRDRVLEMGVRTLQKEVSADKRLEEATRILRDAQAKVQGPQVSGEDLARLVRHGSDEEAAQVMNHLAGRQQATPEEIIHAASQMAIQQMRLEGDAEWFKREYSDVMSDPYLVRLLTVEEDRRRAEGDNRPHRELFSDIGNDLRKWRGGQSNVVATQQQKQERKATITNVPSAAARKAPPAAEKEQTVDDIIAGMRKARGRN